jgi:CPA1 family monovalent cation:H+ antiporter
VTEVFYALLALALLLTLVSLLVPVAERLRLPHTVLLAVLGVGLGFLSVWITANEAVLGVVGDAFAGLNQLELAASFFLPMFLPPLLFTAGLTIDVRRLADEISAVFLLAIVAVLVCIGVVAGAVHAVTGVDLVVCLLLGAIVSTTDPAAVIGIFRDVGAPKRLSILAEGESLLNDAVAITAFAFFIDVLVRRALPEFSVVEGGGGVGTFALHVARDFFGGVGTGFLLARAAIFILPRLGESDAAIASVTVSLAYLSYVVADHYLHVSGIIAVVAAALTVAAYGPTHLHPRQWTALRQLWHQLEFWANCLIFVLASMAAAALLPQIGWVHVLGTVGVMVGALVARAVVVFGMLPALEAVNLVQAVDKRYKVILVWGGLRGAVTIVLAMVAFGDDRLPSEMRVFIALLATLFVLSTLFVNATTLGFLMRVLGLDRLSRVELALRDRVLALSQVNVARQLQEVMRTHNARVEGIDVDPVSAGEAEIAPPPSELALALDERLTVGLLTICTQEKELYLELFEQQTLSRRMVALLTARADRLTDAVREGGFDAYAETMRSFAVPGRWSKLVLWLQRRFGYEGLLSSYLADRFEVLMISQEVLAELGAFNQRSVGDLLGQEAADRLGTLIDERRQLVSDALQALALQYPGYADLIKDRQLERASIRFASTEYAQRLREGIISREVYADLRRELNARREAVSTRPALDLGLELAGMIARVPLFASLDREALTEVGKRLRPLVALPREKIIAVGGPPDSMYFIAAGEVTVRVAAGPVVLKEGDFFGEMGLLGSVPRNADVISNGYCHLLVLYRKDFNALLSRRPEVRAEIEAVAARRVAEVPAK